MASEKTINIGMYATDTPRSKEIGEALEKAPELDRSEIEEIATKLNVLIATGNLTLKPAELQSLKTLSSKFIPDAPKEVNIKAEVKTEQVIMGWLAKNGELESLAEQRALNMAPIQDANYELLSEFADEIRGETK